MPADEKPAVSIRLIITLEQASQRLLELQFQILLIILRIHFQVAGVSKCDRDLRRQRVK